MRWTWTAERSVVVGLYVASVLARLVLWKTPAYGDEAWHFFAAYNLGRDAGNVHIMNGETPYALSALFWWRPLFELLLLPAALVSFDAWRLAHLLLTSFLPVFAYSALRGLDVRRPLTLGAGALLAVHPLYVHWGVIVFPDGLLTTFVAGALWSLVRGRPLATGAFLLAAMWTKEAALIAVGALFLLASASAWRARTTGLFPLRLDAYQTAIAAAGALGIVPLLRYLIVGGRPPGWSSGGDIGLLVDHLFLLPWLLVPVLAGLAWPRTRRWSLLALAYPAFYAYYRLVQGGGVEGWYYVLPGYLAIFAATVALDEAWTRTPRPAARVRRMAAPAATVALLLLLLAQVALPASAAVKAPLTTPASGKPDPSLVEVYANRERGQEHLREILSRLSAEDWRTVSVVDPEWYLVLYPFAYRAGTVRYAYTDWYRGDPRDHSWNTTIERLANATVIAHNLAESPFNVALRQVYADCIDYENPSYALVRGQRCPDRGPALREEYLRRTGQATV